MDSFFTTTGSSPPQKGTHATAVHDSCPQAQEGAGALPEELIEALAGLLAEALINDIRQYPDLGEVSPSHASFPDFAGGPVTAPPETVARPQQSERHYQTPTRSRPRRRAHAARK